MKRTAVVVTPFLGVLVHHGWHAKRLGELNSILIRHALSTVERPYSSAVSRHDFDSIHEELDLTFFPKTVK